MFCATREAPRRRDRCCGRSPDTSRSLRDRIRALRRQHLTWVPPKLNNKKHYKEQAEIKAGPLTARNSAGFCEVWVPLSLVHVLRFAISERPIFPDGTRKSLESGRPPEPRALPPWRDARRRRAPRDTPEWFPLAARFALRAWHSSLNTSDGFDAAASPSGIGHRTARTFSLRAICVPQDFPSRHTRHTYRVRSASDN